jgi:hypothetical protein
MLIKAYTSKKLFGVFVRQKEFYSLITLHKAEGQTNEGKSAASFCRQVTAWFPGNVLQLLFSEK